MNPVLICFLVVVTFFFLVCDAARNTTRAGSSYLSHTLNARYSRLACHEGGPEVNCT